MEEELNAYSELYWWNMGKKTLDFKGTLKDLLKKYKVTYTKRKSEIDGLYYFYFKNDFGLRFKKRGLISDFRHLAKQFIQMELVRLGDKSELYVAGSWRPTVTVNH